MKHITRLENRIERLEAELIIEKDRTSQKEWLTPNDLSYEYGFPISSQSKMRANKKIPFSKIDRVIRYNRNDISAWLNGHKQKETK